MSIETTNASLAKWLKVGKSSDCGDGPMKRVAVLAVLAVGIVVGYSKSPQDLLVGKWTSPGFGEIELTRNGTMYEDGKKIGTYRVVGEQTLHLTDEPSEVTGRVVSEKVRFTVSATELAITTEDETRIFRRKE